MEPVRRSESDQQAEVGRRDYLYLSTRCERPMKSGTVEINKVGMGDLVRRSKVL